MNKVLWSVIGKCVVVYLNDVIIFSKDLKQYVKDVIIVLKSIRKAHLQIKIRKCEFFWLEIRFLKHKISGKGIQTDEEKVKAMREISPPTNIKEV